MVEKLFFNDHTGQRTASWFSFFIAPSPECFFNADRVHPAGAVSV